MNPTPTRTVLVLGANGRLGRAAVDAFAAAGWAVVAQMRSTPRAPLPAGATLLRCDALDLPTLKAGGQGACLIVNGLNPDYTRWAELVPPLTAATVELAAALGARLMLPGNVYNFGHELPPVLTESTPFRATNPKAAQRIELEATLRDAATTRGVKSVVIRAGDFLGDGGTWLDLVMAKRLARGVFTHLGPTDQVHAWAYLPDLARVFVAVAERAEALPAHAVLHYEGLSATGSELQAAAERATGRPLKSARFPWWLMRLVAPVAAMPRALLEMRHLWLRPHRLDETKLRALITNVPHTPLDAVMRDALGQRPAKPASRDIKAVAA